MTKTIITIPDCSKQGNKWNMVDIDIDEEDQMVSESKSSLDTRASDVNIHYVKFMMAPDKPDVGVLLEGGPEESIYVEDLLVGGQAEVAQEPGLLPGVLRCHLEM